MSSVRVAVGDTERVSVGYAHGLICDDVAIVGVSLESGKTANLLVVTGKQPGQTTCRAGTGESGPQVTVTIVVTAKRALARPTPLTAEP